MVGGMIIYLCTVALEPTSNQSGYQSFSRNEKKKQKYKTENIIIHIFTDEKYLERKKIPSSQ